jgi:hypothetical protein
LKLAALALAASLWAAGVAAQPVLLDCTYESRANGDMLTVHDCATKDEQGKIRLPPRRLAQLKYDRGGLAGVFVEGWYYVTRDGRSAAVVAFDNSPDPFAEGLARSPAGGKIGFVDRRLQIVIPARFDGAFPFAHGLAVVCVGCRREAHDEHRLFVGGSWGCIDRQGRVVAALRDAPGYTPCPQVERGPN